MQIAYETWGELNADRSNAVLLHTGLSASSHAKSHSVSLIDLDQASAESTNPHSPADPGQPQPRLVGALYRAGQSP